MAWFKRNSPPAPVSVPTSVNLSDNQGQSYVVVKLNSGSSPVAQLDDITLELSGNVNSNLADFSEVHPSDFYGEGLEKYAANREIRYKGPESGGIEKTLANMHFRRELNAVVITLYDYSQKYAGNIEQQLALKSFEIVPRAINVQIKEVQTK